MLQRCRDAHLAPEPLRAEPLAEVPTEDLDHDLAPERDLVGDEDAAHAAAAEFALDGVGAR